MSSPKILVIHNNTPSSKDKHSAVHEWRLARPIRELKKHVDWQIDERPSIIAEIDKYKDASQFSQEEMERTFTDLCQYDIIWSSYQTNPTVYSLLKVAEKRAGTQYIMDIDDNIFAINEDNPVWTMVKDENVYHMQCMARDNSWISTTNEDLADEFRKRRELDPGSVLILPNFIADDYPAYMPVNEDKVVIGFFGGASHYKDVHNSGFMPALRRIMHENKNVHYKSVGMIIDDYLPRKRAHTIEGKMGDAWLDEVFPSLHFDVSIAPLLDNLFNDGKSDIKWQESTRMGSLFVASDIGPYHHLNDSVAIKTPNTEDGWYDALDRAVKDIEGRKKMVRQAQMMLEAKYKLEDQWVYLQAMFETVYQTAQSKKSSVLLSK